VQGDHHLNEIGEVDLHDDKKEITVWKGCFRELPTTLFNELANIVVNHHLKRY
jgi:hypothetical protein